MRTLGEELREHCDTLAQRWYERWLETHASRGVSEAALKDSLPAQLRLIGRQLEDLSTAERPDQAWKITERLDPEARVEQQVPIEEMVQEYALAIDVVRGWVEEREIEVPFAEFSYFHTATYELTAESVRRYAAYQADEIRKQRAQYLAGVMHQLRTPLAALSVQVEILRDDPRRDAASIHKLQRNVRRIQVLVDGILRLERFHTWEVPVRPQKVYPAQLIDDIVSDHEVDAARKGLRFEAHVNRSLRMDLDPDLFLDALGNLVQNAIKYTARGFVIIDATERNENVLFCVRDSGPGIPPEKQRHLFKHALPGSVGGAGIGLQIAQHAARAQGGEIEVASEVGRGTVFSLRLPRTLRASDARENTPHPQ